MTWASAAVAVISACVCLWYAAKAVRADRERMRRGRDEVWQRRIEEQRGQYTIDGVPTLRNKMWGER